MRDEITPASYTRRTTRDKRTVRLMKISSTRVFVRSREDLMPCTFLPEQLPSAVNKCLTRLYVRRQGLSGAAEA